MRLAGKGTERVWWFGGLVEDGYERRLWVKNYEMRKLCF